MAFSYPFLYQAAYSNPPQTFALVSSINADRITNAQLRLEELLTRTADKERSFFIILKTRPNSGIWNVRIIQTKTNYWVLLIHWRFLTKIVLKHLVRALRTSKFNLVMPTNEFTSKSQKNWALYKHFSSSRTSCLLESPRNTRDILSWDWIWHRKILVFFLGNDTKLHTVFTTMVG